MALVDTVLDKVVEVVSTLDALARVRACAERRVSCEGWLKVEILYGLSRELNSVGSAVVIAEQNHVDLTVEGISPRILLEVKTFPTNYGRAGKPITNFVDGVIKDLAKLSEKRCLGEIGLAVWLAYPIPEPAPDLWGSHLRKVEAQAATTHRLYVAS